MIDVAKAGSSLAGLALLKFFPSDEWARTELVKLVCEMASTNEQIDWLVKRARNLWSQWEGPHELRALFCSKFKAADGIDAYSELARFADGIPSEKESLPALPAAPMRALPSGNVSASPSIETTIRDLCVKTDLNRIGRPKPRVAEIPVIRVTEANRIQQADIDRALQLNREAKAKQEIGL
jgi:hypothetical protein